MRPSSIRLYAKQKRVEQKRVEQNVISNIDV